MAHTIGKFQYLLIERTYVEGKQIDEYFELANSEKIAIAMAEEWERGYNATQIAPNVLRAEFDTGFGTTEIRELALLSVPVVTGVSGTRALRNGYVYVLVHSVYDEEEPYDEMKAFTREGDASIEMMQIIQHYRKKGLDVIPNNKQKPNSYNFYSNGNKLEATVYVRKITAYRHDWRRY